MQDVHNIILSYLPQLSPLVCTILTIGLHLLSEHGDTLWKGGKKEEREKKRRERKRKKRGRIDEGRKKRREVGGK